MSRSSRRSRRSRSTLGVGVVGTGFGRVVHVPAFQNLPGVSVIGIASANPDRAVAAAHRCGLARAFTSWKELVECPDVDVVTVATPPASHLEIVHAALRLRKAVFCEKPLALEAEDAAGMLRAAEIAAVVHGVDFEFRQVPALRAVREMVGSGELGRLRRVTVTWTIDSWADQRRPWSWQSDHAQGGGVLGALGVHVVDYLEWLFAPIRAVAATLETRVTHRPDAGGRLVAVTAYDSAALEIGLADGTPVAVVLSNVAPRAQGHWIEITGERRALAVGSDREGWVENFAIADSQSAAAAARPPAAGTGIADGRVPPTAKLAEAFVEAIRANTPSPSPSFHDGLRAQTVLDATLRAHHERRRVELRP